MNQKILPLAWQTYLLRWCLTLICLGMCSGCGGGSIGTGTEPQTKTIFAGAVTSESGAPVAGATLRLVNTNEITISGADGSFELLSTLDGGTANFVVTAGAVEGSVDVQNVPSDGAVVNVDVVVDFTRGTVSLSNLSITAKIEGVCDPYFENGRIIRQSGRVPDGMTCPFRVRTRSSTGPVSGLRFVLQRKRCFDGAPWHDVGSGVTGDPLDGLGEITFAFSNDEQHCVYRILVPIEMPGIRPQEFLVNTFRKQAFDAGVPFDPNEGDGR